MWFDLLLIILAISPLLRTARFFARESETMYSGGDEAGFSS